MNKKIIGIILLSFFICGVFCGCAHDKIKFYRESKFDSMMQRNHIKQEPAKVNSSGMLILKDESSYGSNIKFGPSDINFDLPSKFK